MSLPLECGESAWDAEIGPLLRGLPMSRLIPRREFVAATVGGLFANGLTRRLHASAKGIVPAKVVVWDERQPDQKEAYAQFLGNEIAGHLRGQPGLEVVSSSLDDPDQGLGGEVLKDCRVLVWWGHVRQAEIAPETGRKIVERIQSGSLSLIALHSAHWSTPFMEAMNARARSDLVQSFAKSGAKLPEIQEVPPPRRHTIPRRDERITPYVREQKRADGSVRLELHQPYCCFPSFRNDGLPSQVKVVKPDHPIADGVPATFQIPHEEMYDEPFHVPEPDSVIFEEHWESGERFRSGMLWRLGKGYVFYFRPGHETYPTYKQEMPLRIVANATRWLATRA
jgi:trehalose utilization protein